MMDWSDEQTISFIEMYRERSLLWDPTDSLYKNRNKRHDGLMEIAVSFGIEKCDVEKKIKNLQSQFSRERNKEKKSLKTGSGADEKYTSKWFAYKSLLFLADKNTPKNTQDTEESQNREDQEKHDESDGGNADKAEDEISNAEYNDAVTRTPIKKTFTSPKKPLKKVK
nr:uncharacterized protein LOC111516218 [Leptinotarsa decemlineata]